MIEKQPQILLSTQARWNAATSGPSSRHMISGLVSIDRPCSEYSGNTTRSMVAMLRRALPTIAQIRSVCAPDPSGVTTTGSLQLHQPDDHAVGRFVEASQSAHRFLQGIFAGAAKPRANQGRVEFDRIEVLRSADAAQGEASDRGQAGAGIAEAIGEALRDQQRLVDRPAHGGDAADFVDSRADDGEIEAVLAADIAVEHLADMQAEIHLGGRQFLGFPALVEHGDRLARPRPPR